MNEMSLAEHICQELRLVFEDAADDILQEMVSASENVPLTSREVKLLTKAMLIASQLSAQYVIRFLELNGELDLPDIPPELRLIPGGLPDEADPDHR